MLAQQIGQLNQNICFITADNRYTNTYYTHLFACLAYSTARFKLHVCEYILASANTFLPSSQPMLMSKGSMLSSKGNMLSYMILLAIEVDAHVQLLARSQHRAVSTCTRARLHALMHYLLVFQT